MDTTNSWLHASKKTDCQSQERQESQVVTQVVSENIFIAFTKDKITGIAKRFGKSVASSAHYQLRQMLSYKMPKSGGTYVEPDSKLSTKTCNECGSQSGPTGLAGLSVRQWVCRDCGASHDRDVNAAINTPSRGGICPREGDSKCLTSGIPEFTLGVSTYAHRLQRDGRD